MNKEQDPSQPKPKYSYRWLNLQINWPPAPIIDINHPHLEIHQQKSIIVEKYIHNIPEPVALLLYIFLKNNWQEE